MSHKVEFPQKLRSASFARQFPLCVSFFYVVYQLLVGGISGLARFAPMHVAVFLVFVFWLQVEELQTTFTALECFDAIMLVEVGFQSRLPRKRHQADWAAVEELVIVARRASRSTEIQVTHEGTFTVEQPITIFTPDHFQRRVRIFLVRFRLRLCWRHFLDGWFWVQKCRFSAADFSVFSHRPWAEETFSAIELALKRFDSFMLVTMLIQLVLVGERYRADVALVHQAVVLLILPACLYVHQQSPMARKEPMTLRTLDRLYLQLATDLLVSVSENSTVELLVAELAAFVRLNTFMLVQMCLKHLICRERNRTYIAVEQSSSVTFLLAMRYVRYQALPAVKPSLTPLTLVDLHRFMVRLRIRTFRRFPLHTQLLPAKFLVSEALVLSVEPFAARDPTFVRLVTLVHVDVSLQVLLPSERHGTDVAAV